MMLFSRLSAAILAVCSVAAIVAPSVAQAAPISTWAARNTGLDSVGKCTRRAFQAFKNVSLDGKASGEFGVVAFNAQHSVTILCIQNGAMAAVFCAADSQAGGPAVTNMCNNVSRQMMK